MTIALDTTWDEAAHLRELSSGQFLEHLQSDPEIDALAGQYESGDRDPYNPVFHVPAHMLGAVQARVDAANAKLARAGIEDRFTFTAEHVIERRQQSSSFEFANVTLNRPSICFEGWSFTGAHDFTPGGGVLHLHMTKGAPDVTDNHCDHCSVKRARNRVYTVVHPDKGAMQVGASCLEAFLGMKPTGLWAIGDDLGLDETERMFGMMTSQQTRVYPTEELVVAALTATDDGRKFVSMNNAVYPERPTAYVVRDKWNTLLAEGDTRARQVLARKVIRWAKKIDAEPGSYLDNLHQVFAGKKEEAWVRAKHVGFAVSVVSAYQREMDKGVVATATAKVVEQKEYLAPVKGKIENVTATIQSVRDGSIVINGHEIDNTWMRMISDSGHILTWKSSAVQDVHAGDRVTISRASVKDNVLYNGSYQTVLTRAKMEPVDE